MIKNALRREEPWRPLKHLKFENTSIQVSLQNQDHSKKKTKERTERFL